MKIRKGFISNSSSSSFIIIGDMLNNEYEALDLFEEDQTIYVEVDSCGDGFDIFEIDEIMLNFIIDNRENINYDINFYVVDKAYDTDYYDSILINKNEISKESFRLFVLNKSNHSCKNINDIKKRYIR